MKTVNILIQAKEKFESIEKINEYLNNNIDEVNKFNETKKQINLLTKKYKRKLKELTDKI
jgi:DNA repair ATPase RecN